MIRPPLFHGFQALSRDGYRDFFAELGDEERFLLEIYLTAARARRVELRRTRAIRIAASHSRLLTSDCTFSSHSADDVTMVDMGNQKGESKTENDKSKWKKEFIARLLKFSVSTFRLCDTLRQSRTLWALSDQLIRCSASVGANVVEAQSASSKNDYIKFFEIALKSSNETKYWLLLAKTYDVKYQQEVDALLKEATEINNIIAASVLTLKGKR